MGLINLNSQLIRLITNQLQIGNERPNYMVKIYKTGHYDSDPYIFTGKDGGVNSIEINAGVDNLASTCSIVFHNVDYKRMFTKDIQTVIPEPPLTIGGLYISPKHEKVLVNSQVKVEAILVTSRGNINVTESDKTQWSASPGITVDEGLIRSGDQQGEFTVTATYTDDDGNEYTATCQIYVCSEEFTIYDSVIKLRCWDAEDLDRDSIRILLNNEVIEDDMELTSFNESKLITLNLKPGINVLKVQGRGSGRAYLEQYANRYYQTDEDWAVYKEWIDNGALESEGEPYIPNEKLPRSADSGEPGITSSVELYNSDNEVIFSGRTKNFFISTDRDPYSQWYVDYEKYFLIWTFVNMDIPESDDIPEIELSPIEIKHSSEYDYLFEPENKIEVYLGYGDVLTSVLVGAIDSVKVNTKNKTLTIECRDNMRYLIDQTIDQLRFGLSLSYPRRDIKVEEVQTTLDPEQTVVVVQSRVNIRVGPGTNYPVLTTANIGDTFIYLGRQGDWINIRYNDNSVYVHKDYVTIEKINTAPQTQISYVVKATTNGSNLNVRSEPSIYSTIIGKLVNGETVPYVTENPDGTWYKVIVNGRYGWVSARWSTKEEVN